MAEITFTTTGRNYQGDIDALHVTEAARYQYALARLFAALGPDEDYHYDASLTVSEDSVSVSITKAAKVAAVVHDPLPDMTPEELARNLDQQEEARKADAAVAATVLRATVADKADALLSELGEHVADKQRQVDALAARLLAAEAGES